METKKQIRKEVLQKRDSLSQAIRDDENAHIRALIQTSSFYRDAQCMLMFASYGSEADTFPIASGAVRDGKTIYFPLVEGDTMDFYRIDTFDELTAGYHGIMEPKAEETRRFHLQTRQNILMLMPGVCFDLYGGRIGYGGGFYDKYLAKLKKNKEIKLTTIALAFSCQLLSDMRLPRQEHDIAPDYIVTPKQIIKTQEYK